MISDSPNIDQVIQEKIEYLRRILYKMGSALIAYSGGVDSTLLAYLSTVELGKNAVCATIVLPSVANVDLQRAKEIAVIYNFQHVLLESHQLMDPRYTDNSSNRCYWCKKDIYRQLIDYAHNNGLAYVLDGNNLDDSYDFRPGRKVLQEYAICTPLLDARLTKSEIRIAAKMSGLSNWNTPSEACLSTRIPYGTPITETLLRQIEYAEELIHKLGIQQVRVRHHGSIARIEVEAEDFECLVSYRNHVLDALRQLGYDYVTLDLSGYNAGSMNVKNKQAILD